MWPRLLLLSEHEEDRKLARQLAIKAGLALDIADKLEEACRLAATHPQLVLLWDAGGRTSLEAIKALPLSFNAARIFAISEGPVSEDPRLVRHPIFGHHLIRRFPAGGVELYAKLIRATLGDPSSLTSFFPAKTASKKISLHRSSHKTPAIEALQNALQKQGIRGRLAALVAQSADELLLNAIFDAPVDENGQPIRKDLPRDSDLELEDQFVVDLEFASCSHYMGISVTDRFGSLKRQTLLKALFSKETQQEHNLGLRRCMQSGLSLAFTCVPGSSTQAMLFFPIIDNFRLFRSSFQSLSMLMD